MILRVKFSLKGGVLNPLDLREKPGLLPGFSKSLFQNRARERTVN
jgi:hypothetical protein